MTQQRASLLASLDAVEGADYRALLAWAQQAHEAMRYNGGCCRLAMDGSNHDGHCIVGKALAKAPECVQRLLKKGKT
jgi:hypothetical protein